MKTKKRTIKDALAEKAAAKAALAKVVPDEERPDYGMIVTFACGHRGVSKDGYWGIKCRRCKAFEDGISLS